MDDLCRNLESGDKIIDIVSEERVRSDGMQPEGWAERTSYKNNEIPANPPYKAKIYNLSQLTCEDFRSFLTDSGISIVKLEEHNGFCVEVQTPDDLAFIISLDGEYYDEEHGEDDPPIKVRVLYESRYNNHYPPTELTRDMLQGAGAGDFVFRTADSRAGTSGFSRENMGAADHGSSTLDRARFAMSDGASVDNATTSAPLLNFRDSGKASLPVAFSKPPDLDLAFRQKGLSGDLGSMRSGTSCISSYQPAQQKRTYQPPQLSSFSSRRSAAKKTVDENGWTING